MAAAWQKKRASACLPSRSCSRRATQRMRLSTTACSIPASNFSKSLTRWKRWPESFSRCRRFKRSLGSQSAHRLAQARRKRLSIRTLLLLLVDDVFGGAGDKVGIAEFGVETGNLAFRLLQLLFEACTFFREIDHVAERQSRDAFADHELRRAFRNRIGEFDRRQPSERQNRISVALKARTREFACALQ